MNVYSQLVSAQFENLASDPTASTGRTYFNTATAAPKVYTGAAWKTMMYNPMAALGDLTYGGAAGLPTLLAGDTSNTRKFLRTLSVAGTATAPVWDSLVTGDIPSTITQTTTFSGGIILSGANTLSNYTPWTAWVPTFTGLGTVTITSFFARQFGDTLEAVGIITTGTTTAVPAKLNYPAGTTLNTAKRGTGTVNTFEGQTFRLVTTNIYTTAGTAPILFYDGADAASLYFSIQTSGGAFTKANGSTIFGGGDVISIRIFGIPVS